ncbi:hypothetical protein E4L95_04305 [Paracoccus liaowanqingii]|uniref:Uncharacterized protein n=1 Tax=Paracoccus liaowanqingii TaxID=2560053 RepID=A0A4Z1CRM4_9RHOB|nr:hypothetical protein [Paracoccus liaowanqingii]TGN67639.1 hypothetical protein E4L95_04305 [Paracoccus liaowanqingii]
MAFMVVVLSKRRLARPSRIEGEAETLTRGHRHETVWPVAAKTRSPARTDPWATLRQIACFRVGAWPGFAGMAYGRYPALPGMTLTYENDMRQSDLWIVRHLPNDASRQIHFANELIDRLRLA